MSFLDFINQCAADSVNAEPAPQEPKRPTRAERIRSYMDDSEMTRKEATAMVDFEDCK